MFLERTPVRPFYATANVLGSPSTTVGAPGAFLYAHAMIRAAVVAVVLGCLAACASTKTDLERATTHYEAARYEAALIWLNELEPELASMAPSERSTFLYLRGMSSYRLGDRDDAVHYLALARESIGLDPSSLSPSLKNTLERALVVLASGTTSAADSLSTTR